MSEHLLKMELHKVKREILTHGKEYTFYRDVLDDYEEPTGENEEVSTLRGLFHIDKGYIKRNIDDGSVIRTKGQPKLLIEYLNQDVIHNGDYVYINGNKYKVNEKNNIQEYSIIVDISLEVVLNDRN